MLGLLPGRIDPAVAASVAYRLVSDGSTPRPPQTPASRVSVAHLATGWGADIVKVGSVTRGERTAKWNELIRIDDAMGGMPLAPLHESRPTTGHHANSAPRLLADREE